MYLSPHEEQKSPRSLRCTEGCGVGEPGGGGQGRGRPCRGGGALLGCRGKDPSALTPAPGTERVNPGDYQGGSEWASWIHNEPLHPRGGEAMLTTTRLQP